MAELLSAIEKEYDLGDSTDKEMYDDMINECYFEIAETLRNFISCTPAELLEQHDPTSYRCGFNDYVDGLPHRFYCPHCDKLFEDDEDGAKFCCQEENDE